MKFRKRRHMEFRRQVRKFRAEFSRFVLQESGFQVLCGPMKGFKFAEESFWGGSSDAATKFFGLYEQQNLEIFERQSKSVLVDMGAADGFWGVGLVAADKFRRSVLFEISPKGRQVIRETAILNGVENRVTICGDVFENTADNILSVESSSSMIFFLIDIEGHEFNLLTEDFLRRFSKSEFLVELHPQMVENGTEKLEELAEFASELFSVRYISGSVRDTSEMDELIDLGDDFKWPVLSEGRGFPMQWLHLVPHPVRES